jgi:hypothetical protein
LGAREKLAILAIPDFLVDQENKDRLDSMVHLVGPDELVNVEQMGLLDLQEDPASPELRELLEITEPLV